MNRLKSLCFLVLLLLVFHWIPMHAQEENPMEPTAKLGSLSFSDGSSYYGEIELGKPNAKPLTEGNGVNYRILYEAE